MKIPDEIISVAARLGDLRSKVVFVGGMVRSPWVDWMLYQPSASFAWRVGSRGRFRPLSSGLPARRSYETAQASCGALPAKGRRRWRVHPVVSIRHCPTRAALLSLMDAL